jgi:hypothetical protein
MKLRAQYLLTAIAAVAMSFAVIAIASAESCTLEIKRLESQNRIGPTDYLYRSTRPQSFNDQIGPEGQNRIRFAGSEERAAAFKKLVTKEPKYESDHP